MAELRVSTEFPVPGKCRAGEPSLSAAEDGTPSAHRGLSGAGV